MARAGGVDGDRVNGYSVVTDSISRKRGLVRVVVGGIASTLPIRCQRTPKGPCDPVTGRPIRGYEAKR
jgi:hypothetical protein